jgi:hypothetical protein
MSSQSKAVKQHRELVLQIVEDFQTLAIKRSATSLELFQACALLMQAQLKGGLISQEVALTMLREAVAVVDMCEADGGIQEIPPSNCPPSEDLS